MINFFRKKRKRMANDNKTLKYARYAIGEIVLVVFGILIALQINNWNENRKINIQETIYLQDLKNDFGFDIETLNHMISKNDIKINNITAVLSLLSFKKVFTDQDKMDLLELHNPLYAENYFIPEKGTINQIEASSSSNFIKNKELRDLIFRYYSDREREEKGMEQSVQLYQHNYVTPNLVSVIIDPINTEAAFGEKFELTPIDITTLFYNKEYLSALALKMGMTRNQNKVYKNVQEKAEQILIILKEELSND